MSSKYRKLLTVAGVVIAASFGFWLRGCMQIDTCLDSGGRWNQEWGVCERLPDHSPNS